MRNAFGSGHEFGSDVVEDAEYVSSKLGHEPESDDEGKHGASKMAGAAGLWQDPDFPPTKASLGKYINEEVEEVDWVDHEVIWLRPQEFGNHDDKLEHEPCLFFDGSGAGDVLQGQLGDCYLLGALATIATHPQDLIEGLFLDDAEDFPETGKLTMRFYKNGAWLKVTIDTLVPCNKSTRLPLFARSRDLCECWVVLLEKGYAKIHGSYANLNSGSVAEALVDLSGGVSQKMLLTEDTVQALIKNGEFWNRINRYLKYDYALGSSKNVRGVEAEEEDAGGEGILVNHAYSILYAKEIGGRKFVKIRNPWGHGEFTGDWADESELWDENPDVLQAMQEDEFADFTRKNDGTFWMLFGDFVTHYNKVYVCRIFPPTHNQYLIKGKWAGKSAAGEHVKMMDRDEDEEGEGSDAKDRERPAEDHVGWFHRQDGDPHWFNNPQYRIEVTKRRRLDLLVSLMQTDRRMAGKGENVAVSFVIVRKPHNWKSRIWELDPSEVVGDASKSNFSTRFPQREISKGKIILLPKYSYFLIPFTITKDVQVPYILRLFTEGELDITPVPETHSIIKRGTWSMKGESDTAGGPLLSSSGKTNSSWCQNPQFALFIPSHRSARSTVKVVVKRIHERSRKGGSAKVGVCVARPTIDLTDARPRRPKPHAKHVLLQDKPLRPLATSTLSKTQQAAIATTGVVDVDRKLQIQRDEWCIISFFKDKLSACILLRELSASFCERSLIITPMLKKEEEGEFQLEVHSDLPVQIQQLDEARMKTLAGRWRDGTAGGCHVEESKWRLNPRFKLRLHGQKGRSVDVHVTLSRPEDRWATQCKRDSVSCMIGFYILPASSNDLSDAIKYQQGETFQTDFVPMSQISTPHGFTMEVVHEDEYYIIVPCTYAADQRGPFSLCVASEIEFSLSRIQTKKNF